MRRWCFDGSQDSERVLHLRNWLDRARELVAAGRESYDSDELRQKAGESLMMKIGETASRLSRAGVAGPDGVEWGDAIANRNWLIHHYDEINRDITWATLTKDLPAWRVALAEAFVAAEAFLTQEAAKATDVERP